MKDNFDKKCKRLQLRASPRTLQRIRILSQSEDESMAAYIESLINAAWDEQCRIQGYDFTCWGCFPWKMVK